MLAAQLTERRELSEVGVSLCPGHLLEVAAAESESGEELQEGVVPVTGLSDEGRLEPSCQFLRSSGRQLVNGPVGAVGLAHPSARDESIAKQSLEHLVEMANVELAPLRPDRLLEALFELVAVALALGEQSEDGVLNWQPAYLPAGSKPDCPSNFVFIIRRDGFSAASRALRLASLHCVNVYYSGLTVGQSPPKPVALPLPGTGASVDLERVCKRYTAGTACITALDGVSLSIDPGSVVALTGPSGSGKSTLLHMVGAMDVPDSGRIVVGEREVTALDRKRQAGYRRTIGFVFQRFHLLPALSAHDNVTAPVLPYRVHFDRSERAKELLDAVGLAGREDSLPSQLSGGEQQRVAIARALINDPVLLLADEPTGNLDSQTGTEIMDLLLRLRTERGMTVIIATHNPRFAARCDRIVRLSDGRLVDVVDITPTEEPEAVLERITRLDASR